MLRSSSSSKQQSRVGNWERCVLLIKVHEKQQLIKSKIPPLPLLPIATAQSGCPINNSIEEIISSDIFVIRDGRSVANTVFSPLEGKVSALLAQGVLDKLRSLNGYLKGLESAELDDSGMVWIEELSHVCLSAVTAIEDFINRIEELKKRSWMGMGHSKGFLSAFGKSKSQDKLAVEMDKIYAKIQNLSIHRPTAAVNLQIESSTAFNKQMRSNIQIAEKKREVLN